MNRIAPIINFLVACVFFLPSASPLLAGEKPEIFVQMGHSEVISAIAFSPDGRYILSGSDDKTLKLWDVETGREIRTFNGHNDSVP